MHVNTRYGQQKRQQKKLVPSKAFVSTDQSDSLLVLEVNLKAKISLIYKVHPEGADEEACQLLMNTGIKP